MFLVVEMKSMRRRIGVRILESGRKKGKVLEFCAAVNTIAGNALFKKWKTHLIKYESGPSKMQLDYCLVKRNQGFYLKGINVLPNEDFITQQKPVLFDLKIQNVYYYVYVHVQFE